MLLADDDSAFGATMADFLMREGHACEHVPDAAQALEALAVRDFDLLISDIDMPGNRGLELVHAVAVMPDRPSIILVTGRPSIATATKSVGLPIQAYVTKPFEVEDFRRTMRGAVADKRIRRAIAESERRVRAWSEDLERVKRLMQSAPDVQPTGQSYLAMTLGNLIASLGDFAEVAEVLAGSRHQKHGLDSAALTKAVREAIEVLEGTRHLFKSKELAALRKKLEELVGHRAGC